MNATYTENASPKTEVRVGLVLYGGVSLAIYMYGVALEFLRVVRAGSGFEKNIYTDILNKTEKKVVVDIISGTSAGGINGVLLAKALANGLDSESFGLVRSLWLKTGDFSALLNPGRKEMAGLLDESIYENAALQVLKEMDSNANPDKPSVKALDLYISSTDLQGRIMNSATELADTTFNKPIEFKEYRRTFHRKFRKKAYLESDSDLGMERNDFSPDKNKELSKMCRATSAFPFAFRPAKLIKGDSLLEPTDDQTVFLTDGGVLNNKPFSDTIAEIFTRDPFGKVDRILFYVEPDPEAYVKEHSEDEPGFWEIISKSLVGIPSYQSIANDLRTVNSRNRRISQFNELLKRTEQVIKEASEDIANLGDEDYRKALEQQALFKGYQDLKISQLNERLQQMFVEYSFNTDELSATTIDHVKAAFGDAFEELCGGTPGSGEPAGKDKQYEPEKLRRALKAFDARFQTRRFFRLIEVTEGLYQTEGLNADNWKEVDGFMQEISALLERTRVIERRTWNNGAQPPGWFEEGLDRLKRQIISSGANINSELLKSEILRVLSDMLLATNPGFDGLQKEYDALYDAGKQLAERIDAFVIKLPDKSEVEHLPPFERIFTQFGYRDMFIYPIEVIADLGERDPIDIVRISPKDATHITANAGGKLAGANLFHFGGFLKREWRVNDIMWGRLNAAELIVKTLYKDNPGSEEERTALDTVLKEILATDNDESRKATLPGVDYRRYMGETYKVGAETLKDVDTATRFTLSLKTIQSVRDMFKYDMQYGSGAKNKVFALLDKWLGWILSFISVFITPMVSALFDEDMLVRKVFELLIFAIWAWGVITFVLFVLGNVLSLGWLKVVPATGWTALGVAVLAAIFGWFSTRYRALRKK